MATKRTKSTISKVKDEFLGKLLPRGKKTSQDIKANDINADIFERDILSHCYDFSFDRGLKFELVESFVIFCQKLLAETVKQDVPMGSAVDHIKLRIQELTTNTNNNNNNSNSNNKIFPQPFLYDAVIYITQNILQHYHLLVFGFCHARQSEVHEHQVLVEVAPYDVPALVDSKPIAQWKLENDLRFEEENFAEKEQILKKNLEISMMDIEKEMEKYFNQLFQTSSPPASLSSVDEEMDFDVITEQIQRIVTKHSEITMNEINFDLERSQLVMLKNLKRAQLLHATNGGGGGGGHLPAKTLSTAVSSMKQK